MGSPAPPAPRVRSRALVGLSVTLGLLALLFLPLLVRAAPALGWVRSRSGLFVLPAVYFAVELVSGRSLMALVGDWDSLRRWQQALLGALVAVAFGAFFVWLLLQAAE